jgi:hypothetical protein
MFQKELYNGIPNVTEWRVLLKRLHLNSYKLSILQGVQRWIVCTPLSVNVLVTLATQQHLEYHCKALFETPVYLSIRHQARWKTLVDKGAQSPGLEELEDI